MTQLPDDKPNGVRPMNYVKASELQPGDVLHDDDDDCRVTIKSIGRGVIRGRLNIKFTNGNFSELEPDASIAVFNRKGRA